MVAGKDSIGVGVGVLILSRGEVLLVRRGPASKNERGAWTILGGQVELGETLEAAARREAFEESGIELAELRQLITVDHLLPDERQHWVSTCFVGETARRLVTLREPDKADRWGWFALDALPSPLTVASQRMLDFYRAHSSR